MSDDTEKTVREMAKLSVLADRISEIQEKNLKMYPFVFFEGVKSVRISYDLSNNLGVNTEEDEKKADIKYNISKPETNHLRVSYYIALDERLNGQLEKRYEALENSVRNLFWKQVVVEVYFDGKLKYKSKQ